MSPATPWKLLHDCSPWSEVGIVNIKLEPLWHDKCVWHPVKPYIFEHGIPRSGLKKTPMAGAAQDSSTLLASLNSQDLWKADEQSLLVWLFVMRNWGWRPCLHFLFKYTCQRGSWTNRLPSDKRTQNNEKWEFSVETGRVRNPVRDAMMLLSTLWYDLSLLRHGHLHLTLVPPTTGYLLFLISHLILDSPCPLLSHITAPFPLMANALSHSAAFFLFPSCQDRREKGTDVMGRHPTQPEECCF